MNKIIVTGGTGYIGSHTTIELIEKGHEVVIIDDLSNSEVSVLDRIATISGKHPVFYKVDVSDKSALDDALDDIGYVDGVIHFAAKKAVGESVAEPLLYYKVNIQGLLNLLTAMQRRSIENIIFSSSATVYGQPKKLPAIESSPILPAESPYGNTKQIGEEILRDQVYALSGKLKAIALRYFNPIGASESGLIGELPIGVPNNLMPFITQTAIGLRDQLKVFGSDYNTKDGTAVRDYIHVVDIAKAHVVAMDRLTNNRNTDHFEYFNLGTGKGSSVLEVIQSFEKTSGVKLNYTLVDRRPGDVESVYASTKKANDILGWQTMYDLDDMTRTAWAWEQNYRNVISKNK